MIWLLIKTSEDFLKYLNKVCEVKGHEGNKREGIQKVSKMEMERKEDKE